MPYLDSGIPGGLTPEEQRRQRLFTIIGGLQGLGQQRGGGGFLGGLLAGFSGGIGGQLQGEQYALEGRREARDDQRLERQNQLAELTLGSRLEEAQQERQSRQAAMSAVDEAAAAETDPRRARALKLAGMLAPEKALDLLKPPDPIDPKVVQGVGLVQQQADGTYKTVVPEAAPSLTPYQQIQRDQEERRLRISEQEQARKAAGGDKPPATLQERDRDLIGRVQSALAGGGTFDQLPGDLRRQYERVFREKAAPTLQIDPATGLTTRVTPDVSDLPVPPSYAAPGGGAPGQAPAAGLATVAKQLGREQIAQAGEAVQLRERSRALINETIDTLDKAGPLDRLTGDTRGKLDVLNTNLIALQASVNNAGVLQEGERRAFADVLGNLTGVTASGKQALGLDTTKSRLKTILEGIDRDTASKLPKVSSEAEALAIPPGVPFLLPDGRIGRNPGG